MSPWRSPRSPNHGGSIASTSPGGASGSTARLLYRGAEADIIKDRWQGLQAVYKIRRPLAYRLKILDDAIRRHRTIREAEMMHHAKRAGVPTPFIYDVDVPAATLVMEYVQGTRLRDAMATLGREEAEGVFQEFGRDVAKLHSAGIVHGDLTTANVVVRGGVLVFIDFGLSFRTTRLEDQAVDLRLIKETLVGAHPETAKSALGALFTGYAGVVGQARFRAAQRQLRSIERRGRYARVT